MAQLLVKAGDQGAHPSHYKDGDVVKVFDDGHVFGRCEDLDVWIAEGIAGSVTVTGPSGITYTHDTSAQTADNFPGHFAVVHVPGPKEDYAHLVEEGPVRVRGLPDYKSLAKGHPKGANAYAAAHHDLSAKIVDRVIKTKP